MSMNVAPRANANTDSTGPGLSRIERRKQEMRDRIFAAAGSLFVEQGYRVATVDAICERADIARQTFFNHFSSKDALLEALVEAGVTFFRVLVDRAREEGTSTRERLGRLFEGIAQVAVNLGPKGHEFIAEALRFAHSRGPEGYSETVREAVERLVERGIEEGDVTPLHRVDDLVSLVLGGFSMHISQWAAGPSAANPEAAIRMGALLADALECHPARTRRKRRLLKRVQPPQTRGGHP